MEIADILASINVTQAQVDEWKEKEAKNNGDVHLLTVRAKGSDENHYCIVKTPGRIAMKRMSEFFDQPVKASEVLLDECWLAGDPSIKTDERLFYAASEQVSKLKEKGEAEIAKL